MKNKALLFLLFLIHFSANAQEIKRYTWDEKPVFKTIPEEYKSQPAVVLFDKREIFTRVGQYALATFVMNHFAVKINKSEAINDYNKIKAEDVGTIRDLRDFHARIIKPNGEIKVLPQDKIVERDVDKVKSIVFEGVEEGDILEYYFILKEYPTTYAVEVFQKEIPVLYASFTCDGSGVKFDIFDSNDFQLKKESSSKSTYSIENIEPYKKEYRATNVKYLKKIIYSLSQFGFPNNRLWVNYMPDFRYPLLDFIKKKGIENFIDFLDLKNPTFSTDDKIIKLDNYFKENFEVVQRGENPAKIKILFPDKQKLTGNDLFNLYGFILKELEIAYEIRVGTNRFDSDIDPQSIIPVFGYEFMYYIPETSKYISPYERYLPYGYPLYEVLGSKGIGYTPSSKRVVENITFPTAPSNYTQTTTVSNIALNQDFTKLEFSKKANYTGFLGQMLRNSIKYYKEKKEDKEVLKMVEDQLFSELGMKVKDYTFDNLDFKSNYSNTPIVFNANIEPTESFIETAGNLLIINIGKTIGNQTDLYQEKTRKYDIDLNYAQQYQHTINFTIPDGYAIQNLKDFVKSVKMTGGEFENKCFFNSSAKVEGKTLIIETNETYDLIHYPVAKYDEYRNVMNAAADFFKATLVLKPTK